MKAQINVTMGDEKSRGTSGGQNAMLLSVDEVAKIMGCSERTVYRLCDAGKMPGSLKIGGMRRWSRVLIENWIASGCPDLTSEK